MSEQFWFGKPAVLLEHWMRFVPLQTMSTTEALNAVVRFTVYASVLLFVATGCQSDLVAIPIVAATTFALHALFPNGKTLVAFIGSIFGPSRPSEPESKALTRENFTLPTVDNPFMNVQLTDIQDNPDRPDAAPITDRRVKKAINEAFAQTSNIYMDTTDLFNLIQSQRNFYAVPADDHEGFLKFLGKNAQRTNQKGLSEGFVVAKGTVTSLPIPSVSTPPTGVSPA